ncbi:MAG: hypothetical protein QOG86_1689 [Thermoleophilaceae bacterium]|nr:hypothetical protein [Thermoleophilaceae bacterium]MEA2350748.1 hypothetical protein [Thermoleophilaceae bacterium]
MSYFQAVRVYSALEACVFSALLVVWIGGLGDRPQLVLGWCHGVGWLFLCTAVLVGCVRGVFPWPVLAATVSPLGPIGASVAIEIAARRRRVA